MNETPALDDFERDVVRTLQVKAAQLEVDEPSPIGPVPARVSPIITILRRPVTAAAAVLLLAGAVVTVAALVGRDSGSGSVRTDNEPERPTTPTDDPLAGPEGAEVDPDAVVVLEMRYADGSVEIQYSDESMFHTRFLELDAAGNPVSDSSTIQVEDRTAGCSIYVAFRAVDHVAGTWYEADIGVSDVPPSRREADLISLNVDRGLLVPDGSAIVDGRELLRYLSAFDGQPDPVPTVTWVDPGTGRPVKVDGHATDDAAYVGTYEYLPRSPENLALLDTPVPEGYVNTGTLDDDDDFAGPDPLCSEESVTG